MRYTEQIYCIGKNSLTSGIVFESHLSTDNIPPIGQVNYLVATPTGESLGQLFCKGQTTENSGVNVSEFINPSDAAEPLFLFYQEGPSNITIQYYRAVIAVGVVPWGKAVRLE